MRFGRRLYQARGNPHAIAVAPGAPLEEVVGLQRFADLAGTAGALLEHHRRVTRNDADAVLTQLPELRDHLFGEPVCEVPVLAALAQVHERKHGEPGFRSCRLLASCVGLQRTDEPVASPWQRLDEPWTLGIVSKRGSQPFHGGVEAVFEIDEGATGPEPLPELVTRDQVAPALEHHQEDLEGLLLQSDPPRTVLQFPRAHVQLEGSETHPIGARRCIHATTCPRPSGGSEGTLPLANATARTATIVVAGVQAASRREAESRGGFRRDPGRWGIIASADAWGNGNVTENAMKRIGVITAIGCCVLLAAGAVRAEVTLNSVRVAAADTVALAKFYQSAFGMHEVNRIDVPGGPEIFVNFGATLDAAKANKSQPIVIMHRDSDATKDPIAHVILNVTDMAATVAAIKAAGGSMDGEPRPFRNTGIVIGIAVDPAGNRLELIQRAAASR